MGFLRNTASDGFSAQKCKKMLDRLGGAKCHVFGMFEIPIEFILAVA